MVARAFLKAWKKMLVAACLTPPLPPIEPFLASGGRLGVSEKAGGLSAGGQPSTAGMDLRSGLGALSF